MSTLAKVSAAVLLAGALHSSAAAADGPTKPLELMQIFGPTATTPERQGAIRWLPGGAAYSKLEMAANAASGMEVARYDAGTGKRSVVVNASELFSAGTSEPLMFTDHEWSADGG